ncbi:hypothetical protein BDV93DRAFT_606182 [Ceratobasidium sp. AG-I]|nr:hypothetical protein BDV93DRAFT_606182 [Ceratobasidium sp. AG-I]
MASSNPSSESSYFVRLHDEHVPTPSVEVQEHHGHGAFDLGDGDFKLCVNGSVFKTHAYLLKKFARFKNLVKSALQSQGTASKSSRRICVQRDNKGIEDFHNTFKILYASVVDGPFEFDTPTLISALRIATAYDHPSLRAFATKHLESVSLTAIERIGLSREFGFSSWEGPAYVELCERDEAITKEEAGIMGIDAFVRVAKIREEEQRRRGRVVDAVEPSQDGSLSPVEADEDTSLTGSKTPSPPRKKSAKKKATKPTASSDNINEGEPSEILKPSFIGIPTPGAEDAKRLCGDSKISQYLEVPGCECKGASGNFAGQPCPCRIAPCVYEAIKALQTQHAAHIANMHNIEETIQEIGDRDAPALTLSVVVTPVTQQVMKWLSGMRT